MQSNVQTVGEMLATRGQWLVPCFQRPYAWGPRQWQLMWGDVARVLRPSPDPADSCGPFLGTLVRMPQAVPAGGLPTWHVLDGHQRLTTVVLLLAALRDAFREREEDLRAGELTEEFLINAHKTGIARYKLVGRPADRDVLQGIVEGRPAAADEHRLQAGVLFFSDRIRRRVARDADILDRIEAVVTAGLSFVTITLDDEHANEIVATLADTARPPDESDFIRDYLFMQVPLDRQSEFEAGHWQRLESAFAGRRMAGGVPVGFYRDYLTRAGIRPRPQRVFREFRRHFESVADSPEAAVDDLLRFATFDRWIDDPPTATSPPLVERLQRSSVGEGNAARPLLLHLLDCHACGALLEDDMLGCLDDLRDFLDDADAADVRRFGRRIGKAIAAASTANPRAALREIYQRTRGADDGAADTL
jgi:hypothetical protein